jgi:DNA replication protein DnaC
VSQSQPNCPKCHDKGWIEYVTENGVEIEIPPTTTASLYLYDHPNAKASVGHCVCKQQQIVKATLDRLMGEGGVPPMYRTFTFESWDNLPERDRRGKEAARELCELFGAGNFLVGGMEKCGLILAGDTGRGKTGLASCCYIMRAEHGQTGLWIDFSKFLRKVRDTYRKDSDTSYEEILGSAASVPFLFIDDLGDMARKQDVSDNMRDIVYDLVSERYNNLLPTLITTNLNFNQFRTAFGDRLAYRLHQIYHWCDVSGTNMRDE